MIAAIVAKDGIAGLASRGLLTKVLTSGLQGIIFTVMWKEAQRSWQDGTPNRKPDPSGPHPTSGNLAGENCSERSLDSNSPGMSGPKEDYTSADGAGTSSTRHSGMYTGRSV